MFDSIYINLPVQDLDRSKTFYTALGFTLISEFTNEHAACVKVSDAIYVMLLTHPFFESFSPRPISNAKEATEVLLCVMADTRAGVDELVARAVAAGGSTYNEPREHGAMYGHGFQDPDGHIWEVGHMPAEA